MANPESVRVERGTRTGQMIIVAVDSTRLGPALGGCRIKIYPGWRDGLDDALRLAAAMTEKAALAGLAYGGGKTVVALAAATAAEFTGPRRDELLADVAEVVDGFGGRYYTGPDIGSGPADMAVLRRRTAYALCLPESAGGGGDSSRPTAAGVLASIDAVREQVFAGRAVNFAVLGLGRVGALVAAGLAAAGARLTVTDIDPSRRALAAEWGAAWVPPARALAAEVDVVVPAAVGGILRPDTVGALRCRAIVGPANNQLDADSTADLLHARGICWAPDTVVSAGGIVATVAREIEHAPAEEADRRVREIGRRLGAILAAAARLDVPPLTAARHSLPWYSSRVMNH